LLALLVILAECNVCLCAQEPVTDREAIIAQAFVILETNCQRCHNASDRMGGLDMTTRASLWRGGDSGAVVSGEDVSKSLLLRRVREGSMPPVTDGDPLSAQQISQLQRWIAMGTPWPTSAARTQATATERSQHLRAAVARPGVLARLVRRLRFRRR
jgi:mono/diheme cytochrome c family protein